MNPRLTVIQIILRSFINYQTNYSPRIYLTFLQRACIQWNTWNELTIFWNEVTIWWNKVTKGWNEVAWNEVVMERSDRNWKNFDYSSCKIIFYEIGNPRKRVTSSRNSLYVRENIAIEDDFEESAVKIITPFEFFFRVLRFSSLHKNQHF